MDQEDSIKTCYHATWTGRGYSRDSKGSRLKPMKSVVSAICLFATLAVGECIATETADHQPTLGLSVKPLEESEEWNMAYTPARCQALGNPVGVSLRGRDLLALPYPVFNGEAYVLLRDLHRPKCHHPPKKNLMFLIIGGTLLPPLPVGSKKVSDEVLEALRKNASLFRPLVFDRSGVSSVFQYKGTDYRITVLSMENYKGEEIAEVSVARESSCHKDFSLTEAYSNRKDITRRVMSILVQNDAIRSDKVSLKTHLQLYEYSAGEIYLDLAEAFDLPEEEEDCCVIDKRSDIQDVIDFVTAHMGTGHD